MSIITKLSVNLNKVALLRNQRDIGIPDVLAAARVCIESGAHGITVHPRPDERHIRATDVDELRGMLGKIEFNIEGNPLQEHLMPILRRVKPTQATLVPDDPAQATSDHGWDLTRDAKKLRPLIQELKELGCRVSLFMDAVAANMTLAAELGADRVELYTEPYATAHRQGKTAESLPDYIRTAEAAKEVGLELNAGHDLNLENLPEFLAAVPGVLEVSIGHALIADALEIGFCGAVKAYLTAIAKKTKKFLPLKREK